MEKIKLYLTEYLHGLNPIYWYTPDSQGLVRHIMKGYGYLLGWTLPFMVIGLVVSLRNIRKPIYRVPLVFLLAAPSGAALVEIGVTRALVIVVPVAVLTGLGLSVSMEWLERRMKLSRLAVTLPLLVVMVGFSFYMLRDALVNGPTWFDNYGLSGMQYGAGQVFHEIDSYMAANPDTKVFLSPSWANGTNTVARFFEPDPMPFQMESIDGYFDYRKPLDDTMVFVMIPEEYKRVIDSNKFTDVRVEKVLPYPDGSPGFYFAKLRYVDNIGDILEQERALRKVLQQESVAIDGAIAQVGYSYLDMGSIDKLFDGDENSLVRTMEANPFVLQMSFSQPKTFSSVGIRIGGAPSRVLVTAKGPLGDVLWGSEVTKEATPDPRTVTLSAPQAVSASSILIEVQSLDAGEPTHVHIWEVKFK